LTGGHGNIDKYLFPLNAKEVMLSNLIMDLSHLAIEFSAGRSNKSSVRE
jgi:hypothetical protein